MKCQNNSCELSNIVEEDSGTVKYKVNKRDIRIMVMPARESVVWDVECGEGTGMEGERSITHVGPIP